MSELRKLAYSIAELCELAGVGRSFLYEEVKAGHLVVTKAGRRSIVLHDDALAWLTNLPKLAPTSTPPGGTRGVSRPSTTTLKTLLEQPHLDFSQFARSRTFLTSPPAAFGAGSNQVISQSIGSEALCAFRTAIFGCSPQLIGRDNPMRIAVIDCHVGSSAYDYSGELSASKYPICNMIVFRNSPAGHLCPRGSPAVHKGVEAMNAPTVLRPAVPVTLKDVVDRLASSPGLSDTRRRDLRSAVVIYGKLKGEPLSAILLDLAAIRRTLDGIAPAQAKVSRKRWANLRSDLTAAMEASGLQPMLRTADVELDSSWDALLRAVQDKGVNYGLSRLARWSTARQISPAAVDDAILEQFFAELETTSLVRNLRAQRRSVAKSWNRLATLAAGHALRRVQVPSNRPVSTRVPWLELPASFREEVEKYLLWCGVPDPLDDKARARALAPETVRLRRDHIHLAASAACASGIDPGRLTSLAELVEPETFRALLRHLWAKRGGKLTCYTRDVAVVLTHRRAENAVDY